MSESLTLVGVDVGGTKVAAYLSDGQSILNEIRLPTDLSSNQATVDCIIKTVKEVTESGGYKISDLDAVGVGIPGMVSEDMVNWAVNLKLERYPLRAKLQSVFGVPVVLENDVRMATIGVYDQVNKAAPIQSMAYLSIGTGIAAGIILNGKLYRGANGMAGEIGHVSLTNGKHGPACNCGQRGCYERYTAGPALIDQAKESLAKGVKSSLAGLNEIDGEDIFAAYRQGDLLAAKIINQQVEKIALAVRWLIMAYDVEKLVIGGGVAAQGDSLISALQAHFDIFRNASPLAAKMYNQEKILITTEQFKPPGWGAVILAKHKVLY